MTLHQSIAKDVMKVTGAKRLRCLTCEKVQVCETGHFAHYLRDGWPKCCGYTMRLESFGASGETEKRT